MKRKDQWFGVSYDNGRNNELLVKENFDVGSEIKIFNKEKKLVRNWMDLSSGESDNKVEIILTVKGRGQEN
jgi:hypothetical protein